MVHVIKDNVADNTDDVADNCSTELDIEKTIIYN